MRLLFLSNLYPPVVLGGYEIACANVARAMAERGHEVRVLTSWSHIPQPDTPAWVDRSLDLHWHIPHRIADPMMEQRDLHGSVCSSYANTLRLLTVLREFQPDIVYVWNLIGVGLTAMLDLLNLVRVPWALHLMDRIPTDIADNVPAAALGLFGGGGPGLYARARIISMSQHLLDEIERLSGITFPQGTELVPGWADVSDVLPHEAYLRDGVARFVTAGAVREHKGIDLILEASARLKAEGVPFMVDVFGDGDIAGYVDRAHALGVHNQVQFRGIRSQAELRQLYAGYDAFLFPTWEREPFGFTPIEAAACALPPIMTRICGASERLVENVHCLKIDRNAGDLTRAMRDVATGQVDLARIGRAGARLVRSDLSFEHCLLRIESILAAHAQPWDSSAADDPSLPLLMFLKHNLSVSVRFNN